MVEGKEVGLFGDFDMTPIIMLMGIMIMMIMIPTILPIAQQAQAQAYQGRSVSRRVEANGELKYFDVRYDYPYTFWISAYFINDGPDPVEIAINYPDDKFTIKSGGTVTVNRSGAQERIAVVFYVCERGKTATVRITGEY